MAKSEKKIELPEWAKPIWKSMGSPKLDKVADIIHGDLLKRRHGLRRDDIIEILMDAPRNNKSDVVRSTEVCTTGDPLSANTFPGSSYKMSECANLPK